MKLMVACPLEGLVRSDASQQPKKGQGQRESHKVGVALIPEVQAYCRE
jgi:hypothetical protein